MRLTEEYLQEMLDSYPPIGKELVFIAHPMNKEVSCIKRFNGVEVVLDPTCPKENIYLSGKENYEYSKALQMLKDVQEDNGTGEDS